MNFLQKSSPFSDNKRIFEIFQDISVQFYMVAIVLVFILGIAELIAYPVEFFLVLVLCSPLVFAATVLVTLVALYAVWFQSFKPKTNALSTICTSISMLGYLLPVILIASISMKNTDIDSIFSRIILIFTLVISNTFLWHFKNGGTESRQYSLRFFTMLVSDILLLFACSYTDDPETKEALYSIPIAMVIILYLIWSEWRIVVNDMAADTQQNQSFGKAIRLLSNRIRDNIYREKELLRATNALFIYYVAFALCTTFLSFDLWENGKHLIEYYSIDTISLALIAFLLCLFILLWGAFLLATPKGIGAKICTAISFMAIIPYVVYFLFKLLLV